MSTTLSVVIGTYNRLRFLKQTLETVRPELDGLTAEIVVVDGGSSDGTIQWVTSQRDVISIVQHNRGEWRGIPLPRRSWGYFMNLGFRAATGKYVAMLSDDCLVVPGALGQGVEHFDRARRTRNVGAVAFYWRNWPEQTRYWVGLTLGGRMFVNHGLYLREALQDVGFVDEETFRFYHADGDLALKLWNAGYEVIDAPDSYVEHYSHSNLAARSENLAVQQEDWARYHAKWPQLSDPEQDWIERDFSDPHRTAETYWGDLAHSRLRRWRGSLRTRAARIRRPRRRPARPPAPKDVGGGG